MCRVIAVSNQKGGVGKTVSRMLRSVIITFLEKNQQFQK